MGWVAEQLLAGAFDFDLAQHIFKVHDANITGPAQGAIASAGNTAHELAVFHLAEGEHVVNGGGCSQQVMAAAITTPGALRPDHVAHGTKNRSPL